MTFFFDFGLKLEAIRHSHRASRIRFRHIFHLTDYATSIHDVQTLQCVIIITIARSCLIKQKSDIKIHFVLSPQ